MLNRVCNACFCQFHCNLVTNHIQICSKEQYTLRKTDFEKKKMHKILLIIPVIIGVTLSLPFIISSQSGETHFTQEIDPKILEATNGFAIASNMDIYRIGLIDGGQSLFFTVSENTDGFIHMDDPLVILQKIYPENNIKSFQVLIFGEEVPYTLDEGKISFNVNNANIVEIRGIS